MKRSSNLSMMALALAFTVFAGTSVFAADSRRDLSNVLNGNNLVSSTQHFNAIAGIPADSMSETELGEVQGKYTPNPECVPSCFYPRPPFPRPWPVCLSCPPIDRFRLNERYFNALKLNPLKDIVQGSFEGAFRR